MPHHSGSLRPSSSSKFKIPRRGSTSRVSLTTNRSVSSQRGSSSSPCLQFKCNSASTSSNFPNASYFLASSHVLVNDERRRFGLNVLRRSAELDAMARQHARVLASEETLRHSAQTLEELQQKLQRSNVGENVQRGASIRAMHEEALADLDCLPAINILCESFTHFGMGTALGKHGLYMVQLFSG